MLNPVRNSRRSSGPSAPSSALARSYPAEPAVARAGTGRPSPWGRRDRSTRTGAPAPRSEDGGDIDQRQPEGLGHARIYHVPLHHVEPFPERFVPPARLPPPVLGQPESVPQGGVGQSQRRGAGHAAGHVGDAVVENAVHE